jgi:hypothetical protein
MFGPIIFREIYFYIFLYTIFYPKKYIAYTKFCKTYYIPPNEMAVRYAPTTVIWLVPVPFEMVVTPFTFSKNHNCFI